MLKSLFRNKKILVPAIVALLGYMGYTVSQSQVSEVVDMVIPSEAEIAEEGFQHPPQEIVEPTTDTIKTEQLHSSPSEEKSVTEDFNEASLITPERRSHILHGDATGGGHLYGTGKPCKSEFPKHWNEKTIIKEVSLIAANDNLNWEQQRNGYHVTEQDVGTVKVRVVKDRDNAKVITAYPVNLERNPCPQNTFPGNDN